MRGGSRQRVSAIGLWTRLFPYLGIAFLFAINFYWIYNSNKSHEGSHSQLNTVAQEKEEIFKKSIQEKEDAIFESLSKLEEREKEIEETEKRIVQEQEDLQQKYEDLAKKEKRLRDSLNSIKNGENDDDDREKINSNDKKKKEKEKEEEQEQEIEKPVKHTEKPKKPQKELQLEAGDDQQYLNDVDPNAVVNKNNEVKVGVEGLRDVTELSVDEILSKDVEAEIKKLKSNDDKLNLAGDWMTAKIERVQNPTDCDNAKWNFCRVYNNCGGGCVIHQLAYCFLVGFAKDRITVIGDGWRYLRECGDASWNCAFKPMTNCSLPSGLESGKSVIAGATDDDKIWSVDLFSRGMGARFIKWAASDGFHTNTPFYLPPELEAIRPLHGDSRVWVVGHLEKYLLRFNEDKRKEITKRVEDVEKRFIHPVAGVHIRRTDHGREAPFRELSEYMVHVEKWWKEQSITGSNRRVYLATDEPKVLEEAKNNYKDIDWLNYEYKGNPSGFTKEYLDQGRSSMDGFYSLFGDWHFLSRVDFMVGTSSSQVGRMSYELMQNYHPDASKSFVSLDDPWYFP